MVTAARFWIVRHGETDENRLGIMQGHMNTKLNGEGVQQAHLTARALEKTLFTEAYSSDLSRATKTAQIILDKHPGVVLQECQELRERYMGDLEGFKLIERSKMPANMEASAAFSSRATQWWNRAVQRQISLHKKAQESEEGAPGPREVLVATHGGVVVTLTQSLVASRKIQCAEGVKVGKCLNASISVIEVGENGKGTLVKFAGVGHLINDDLVEVNVDVIGLTAV